MNLSFIATRQRQNIQNTLQMKINIPVKDIYFGRGQKLKAKCQQKQQKQIKIIDLINLDPTISRVHAKITFSPAWHFSIPFQKSFLRYMSSDSKNKNKRKNSDKILTLAQLPEIILNTIYQFYKPKKCCVFKDLNSSIGSFLKIDEISLKKNLKIVWGDNREIQIESLSFYKSQDLIQVLKEQQQLGSIIKGKLQHKMLNYNKLYSLLKLSNENCSYILIGGINQSKYIIGRGNNADVILNHGQISRKQSMIYYDNNYQKWILKDGDGKNKSVNGTWLKIASKFIQYTQKCIFKMGRTMVSIDFQDYLNDNKFNQSQILNKKIQESCVLLNDLII